MLVSFIIPVYNTASYLDQCISSVVRQTCSDIELILVDNGSIDASPALCDAWAERDTRIRVIHKTNMGLSMARNVGLKAALGDYVLFLDSDDFYRNPTDLQTLLDIAATYPQADFIGFNCSNYYPKTCVFSPWVRYADSLAQPVTADQAILALVPSGTFPMSACLKLLKRSFLLENNLFFVSGQLCEDIPWFINLLESTHRCVFVNLYPYGYRKNVEGSISNRDSKEKFDSLMTIFCDEQQRLSQRSFSPQAIQALLSLLAYEYCILLTSRHCRGQAMRQLYAHRHILSYTLNPKVNAAYRVYRMLGFTAVVMALRGYEIFHKSKKR